MVCYTGRITITRSRFVFAALLCGLALRWTTAVVTEFYPIFPSYYYTDARHFDLKARKTVENWEKTGFLLEPASPSSKVYIASTAVFYKFFGPQPMIPKIVNGTVAVGAIYFWYRISLLFIPSSAAIIVLWMLALWPTNIFFGSQNTKEAYSLFVLAGALFAFLHGIKKLGEHSSSSRGFVGLWAVAGLVFLFLTGLFRSHVMLFVAVSLISALMFDFWRTSRLHAQWKTLVVMALWIALPILIYRPAMSFVFDHVLVQAPQYRGDPSTRIHLIPASASPEQPSKNVRPFSPEGLTQFRKIRLSEDRQWAKDFSHRKIQTQICPDQEFQTWWDVAFYLPKGMLYALFMPLPGLYPLEGKMGRILAALENAMLFAVFLLAVTTFIRTWPSDPSAVALIIFFSLAAVCYGLFEFDLGAATRHRLQYFPCLFPFAAAFLEQVNSSRDA